MKKIAVGPCRPGCCSVLLAKKHWAPFLWVPRVYLALVPHETMAWQQLPANSCPGGEELAVCASGVWVFLIFLRWQPVLWRWLKKSHEFKMRQFVFIFQRSLSSFSYSTLRKTGASITLKKIFYYSFMTFWRNFYLVIKFDPWKYSLYAASCEDFFPLMDCCSAFT